jgi:hypothetical protein
MSDTSKQRRSRWSRIRGAALPEAGIVAPIFAMIWLVSVYVGKTYEVKYQVTNQSRYDAFNSALNGCSGGSDEGQGNYPQDTSGSGTPDIEPSAMKSSLFTANATAEGQFTYWFNASQLGGYPQTKVIHSKSSVVCTEEAHGVNVFSYFGEMLKSF